MPIDTEAHMAGSATPASIFLLISLFLGTFLIVIATLKIVSYVSQGFVSQRASSQA